MRSAIAALVVVVAALTTASAQPAPATVLANVQKTYASAKDVTADFTQSVTSQLTGTIRPSSGKLYVQRPKFRWDYVDAKGGPRHTYLYDGTELWAIDHL